MTTLEGKENAPEEKMEASPLKNESVEEKEKPVADGAEPKENDDEEPKEETKEEPELEKDKNSKDDDEATDKPAAPPPPAPASSATTEDDEAEPEKRKSAPETVPAVPCRPVKRARTAYFIFSDDKRAEVAKEHPGEGVAAVARALGHLWACMSADDKKVYQERAAEERARLAADIEAWEQANGGAAFQDNNNAATNNSTNTTGSLIFPVSKIRKICKLDPEVRGLSKETVLLVTKAAELFAAKLGSETVRVAQIQNRRKLLPDDVAQVCSSREQFLFLREDIADLTRLQQKEAALAAAYSKNEKKKNANKDKEVDEQQGPKMKPLTAYFAANPSK